MIEKQTILDQIEITRDGTIQVRLALLVLEDDEEISSAWHRTSISPGADPVEQMAAVNVHLQQMNKAPIVDFSWLTNIVPVVHTPEVNKRYADRQAKRLPHNHK